MNKKEYTLSDGRTVVFWYDENQLGQITLEAMNMLIGMIKEKWILCSERKPKQQQPVIITDEGDVLTGYINSLNEWMDFHGNRLKGVIAWMPFPSPYNDPTPQEGEEDD